MAEVVLDANVIVALLYADDSLHQRADLTTRLENERHSLVLVDFLVFEALSTGGTAKDCASATSSAATWAW